MKVSTDISTKIRSHRQDISYLSIMHSSIFVRAPQTTSNCSSETAVIFPRASKRRKTGLQPTSYIPSALASVSVELHGYPGDCFPCTIPEAPVQRGTKRSSPEASCTPDPDISPPIRSHTWTTSHAGLQSPRKPHHLARISEGPTSAAPKPERKQIAVVKEAELKLRREEKAGTPHISEMESDEDIINFTVQDLRLAGTTGFTIDQNFIDRVRSK